VVVRALRVVHRGLKSLLRGQVRGGHADTYRHHATGRGGAVLVGLGEPEQHPGHHLRSGKDGGLGHLRLRRRGPRDGRHEGDGRGSEGSSDGDVATTQGDELRSGGDGPPHGGPLRHVRESAANSC
jgi:hypothetical protein